MAEIRSWAVAALAVATLAVGVGAGTQIVRTSEAPVAPVVAVAPAVVPTTTDVAPPYDPPRGGTTAHDDHHGHVPAVVDVPADHDPEHPDVAHHRDGASRDRRRRGTRGLRAVRRPGLPAVRAGDELPRADGVPGPRRRGRAMNPCPRGSAAQRRCQAWASCEAIGVTTRRSFQ